MPETKASTTPAVTVRYRGRIEQVWIYFGKFARMFVYQNDWKVLPMCALIAGLVAMVMRGGLFQSMEGSLMGCFALTMVCIWNGCFNSIQIICRERDIVKREHRSGMHVSAYVLAHMLYQAMLCLMQTIIMLSVTKLVGIRYDLCSPLFTRWVLVDFGISIFLITYASDMLALWISALSRNTTAAMTIMPFLLIFQLIFSGGMFTLPKQAKPLTNLTVSAPGVNVLAAQGDYNHQPLVMLWNRVQAMGKYPVSVTVTTGQILDFLQKDTPMAQEIRDTEIRGSITVGQVIDYMTSTENPDVAQLRGIVLTELMTEDEAQALLTEQLSTMVAEKRISALQAVVINAAVDQSGLLDQFSPENAGSGPTLGTVLDSANENGLFDAYRSNEILFTTTVGELVDYLQSDDAPQELREKSYTINSTVAELQELIGVEKVRTVLQETAAAESVNNDYEHSKDNVSGCWGRLFLFIFIFSLLTMVTLKFIDKDKR